MTCISGFSAGCSGATPRLVPGAKGEVEKQMSGIRINELARELEVKSGTVLEYLHEIGMTDKKSHSSALDDDVAKRVREHFQSLSQEQPREQAPTVSHSAASPKAAPAAAKPAATQPASRLVPPTGGHPPATPAGAVRKPGETPPPLTRSLAEIQAEARKAVAPPPRPAPAPAVSHSAARPAEKPLSAS